MIDMRAAPDLKKIILNPGTLVVDVPLDSYGHIGIVRKLHESDTKYDLESKVIIRRSPSQASLGEVAIRLQQCGGPVEQVRCVRLVVHDRQVIGAVEREDA